MSNFKRFVHQKYSTLYLLVLAIVFTVIIGGKVTHQGMVLGLISIVTGLLLIYRSRFGHHTAVLIHTVLFCILEIIACIVVASAGDATELWFASLYAIFSILMVLELILMKRSRDRN